MWTADSFLDRAQELVKKATNEHAKYTLQSLTGVAQSKKEQQQEDDSVNR